MSPPSRHSQPAADARTAPGGIRARSSFLLALLVLAIGLLITRQLWMDAQQSAARALQNDFDFHVRDIRSRVAQRMKTYEQVLRGVDGLFAHAGSVTRAEFRDYASRLRLKENYPGIQGIRYSPLVPLAEKDHHIAAVRRQGMSGYAIHPEGKRGLYAPALYIEPEDERNRIVFGYDMLSDLIHPRAGEVAGMRLTAMERARDTGQAALSGKIRLLFETDKDTQAGVLMFLPVYRHGAPHGTLAERRTNIIGWASMVFRMNDLMAGILGEHGGDVDIEIFDGTKRADAALLYNNGRFIPTGDAGRNPLFRSTQHLEVSGRDWTLEFYSLPGFEGQVDSKKPQILATSGILTSILLALLAWLLAHGRALALLAARRMNRELIEREERLRLAAAVFETVDEAVMVTSPENRVVAVNPAFTRITGYSADEASGKDVRVFTSDKHPPEFFDELWQALLARGAWKGEIWNRRKNGEVYAGWHSFTRVYDDKGQPTHHVAVFSDISERKAAEERIRQMAHYDRLTNLPNRTLFEDRFRQALARAKREHARMALIYADLDRFKPVNDTYGHAMGDLLLVEAAKRLQECVRGSDTVSRRGGDEFVVLLSAIASNQDALLVAEKIRSLIEQPFHLAGLELRISSSIGVALYPEHGSGEERLEHCADTAMYRAKEGGRNAVRLYDPEMDSGHL
jgi:diguanylate cyclase (GGDEF)-like protein/PAS domain S-box-containing protein